MSKIKICGLRRLEDIAIVNDVLPDYIGLVFAKSKRQVTEEQAGILKAKLDSRIKAVGVFVNEIPDNIIRLCHNKVIDIIQLHGDEEEEYLQKLRNSVANPIMKAVRVKSLEDIKAVSRYSCDYLLLDAFQEGQYGGSGEVFDWTMIPMIHKPFFLAGGIHGGNVQKAIQIAKPFAIDVSSGVETDGWKDRTKIIDFITSVRSVR